MDKTTIRRGGLALAVVGGLALAAGAWAHDDKFKTMDSNGDGKVSAAEHAAGAKAMFEKMDANHDGSVTAAEMDAGHAMMKDRDDDMHGMKAGEKAKAGKDMDHDMDHGMEMSSADKIAKMDSNGDGMLSAAEHEAGAAAMFKEMDGNGDGSLSRSEMNAGHRMMKKPMDAKPVKATAPENT